MKTESRISPTDLLTSRSEYMRIFQSGYIYIIDKFLIHSVIAMLMLTASYNPANAAKPAQGKPQQVIVAPVRVEEISDRIEALGTARANESVSITANVAEKIKEIHFEDGQQIKARRDHGRAGAI